MEAMKFEKAEIPIQEQQEFTALRAMIEKALGEQAETFLSSMQYFGLNIREFEKALEKGIIERAAKAENGTKLYEKLTLSDQAQMREFYLTRIEELDVELRTKYKKLYRYA